MEMTDVLNILYIAGGVAFIGAVAYLSYKKQGLKAIVLKVLPFLPGALRYLSNKFPDVKGEFDRHDLLQVSARVSEKLLTALRDRENSSLDDLKDEIRTAVLQELDTYRKAGVKNVPELDAKEVERLIDVMFNNIKILLEGVGNSGPEDQSGSNQ